LTLRKRKGNSAPLLQSARQPPIVTLNTSSRTALLELKLKGNLSPVKVPLLINSQNLGNLQEIFWPSQTPSFLMNIWKRKFTKLTYRMWKVSMMAHERRKQRNALLYHFRSQLFESKRIYFIGNWVESLSQSTIPFSNRKAKLYDLEGNVDFTEHHRVFEAVPWALLNENQI